MDVLHTTKNDIQADFNPLIPLTSEKDNASSKQTLKTMISNNENIAYYPSDSDDNTDSAHRKHAAEIREKPPFPILIEEAEGLPNSGSHNLSKGDEITTSPIIGSVNQERENTIPLITPSTRENYLHQRPASSAHIVEPERHRKRKPSEEGERKRKPKRRKEKRYSSSSEDERPSNSETSSPSSSDSSASSDSSSSRERRRKPKKSKKKKTNSKNKFFRIKTKKEQFEWRMSKNLARYANEMSRTYIKDKDIEENILMENQVAINIDKSPTMDPFINKMLDRNKTELNRDKSLSRVGKKITDIYAPLGKVWEIMNNFQKSKADHHTLDVDMINTCLQQTVMLTGQAIGAVNFNRRRNILNALGTDDAKTLTMLRENYVGELKNNKDLLFGDEFREKVEKEAKREKKTIEQYFRPAAKRTFFVQQPFRPASPSKRPDGGERYKGSSNSQGRGNRTEKSFFKPKPGARGENKTSTLQQACKTKVNRSIKYVKLLRKHSPSSKKSLPTARVYKPSSREIKIFRSSLEKTDERPLNSTDNNGMDNSILRNSMPKKASQLQGKHNQNRPDNSGDYKHAGEGSYNTITSYPRGNHQQHFLKGEKRGRSVQTNHKPQTFKPVHTLSKIQNGVFKKLEDPFTTKRLSNKDRSQGCLLQRPTTSDIEEICSFRMAGEPLRVHVPNVWPRTSPTNIYKNHESTNITSEKAKHQNDNLYGRHVSNGIDTTRDRISEGHHIIPTTISRVCNKLREIHPDTVTHHRILRSDSKQSFHDLEYPTKESDNTEGPMSEDIDFQKHISEKPSQADRKASGDSPSIHLCSSTNQTPATSSNQRDTDRELLRDTSLPRRERTVGVRLVDKKLGVTKWKSNSSETPGLVHINRCSKRDIRGLGSSMPREFHGRPMDNYRTRITHQCSGTSSSRTGTQNVHQDERSFSHPPQNGQHHCHQLPDKNGRNEEPTDDKHSQEDMVLPPIQRDHTYSRVHPIQTKHHSGLGISKLERLQRMETGLYSVQPGLLVHGNSRIRPFCIQNSTPITELHKLETRSSEFRDGCPPPGLDTPFSLRFPPFLFNRADTTKDAKTQKSIDTNHTNLGITTMVPTPFRIIDSKSDHLTTTQETSTKPEGGASPTDIKLHIKTSSMVSVGKESPSKALSITASSLISKARSRGTRSNYDSAWRKFSSWCSSRQVDPFSCDIKHIVDFLGELFDRKLEYRTINGYRSALSAYHHPLDGMKVGQHPLVTSLMKGVSNERPPLPRYRYIWDVETVLQKMISLPDNMELSLEVLSIKVVTLLGLCAVNRSSELVALNLKWMSKTHDCYTCAFGIKVKHSRQGKPTPPIVFHSFPENRKICPMTCIIDYETRTEEFRKQHKTQPLFLSFIRPHEPVSRPTLTRWVTKMLDLAGIDTGKFKAHSLRAASSSKAASLGLKLKDILDMGNWSHESVWQKFYHKKIHTPSERFQKALLTDKQGN